MKGRGRPFLKKLVGFGALIGYDVIDSAVQDAAEVVKRRGA